MRDHWLFAIAPYVAAAIFAVGWTARLAAARGLGARESWISGAHRAPLGAAWRTALAVVMLAHLAALTFPDAVLLWSRQELRLIAVEIAGVAAGLVTIVGSALLLSRLLRRGSASGKSPLDVIALTLLLVAATSGLGIAILYRWASAWSEVTLVPYLYSVARLQPSTGLVTRLPALVKLHVASAFVFVAVLPFTSVAGAVCFHIAARARRVLAPLGRDLRPAWQSLGRRTTSHARTAAVVIFGNGGEDN